MKRPPESLNAASVIEEVKKLMTDDVQRELDRILSAPIKNERDVEIRAIIIGCLAAEIHINNDDAARVC